MDAIVNVVTKKFCTTDNLSFPLPMSQKPHFYSEINALEFNVSLVDNFGSPNPIDAEDEILLWLDTTISENTDDNMFLCSTEISGTVSITDAANGKIKFTVNTNTVPFVQKCGSEAVIKMTINGEVFLFDSVMAKKRFTPDASSPDPNDPQYKKWTETKEYIDAAIADLPAPITVHSGLSGLDAADSHPMSAITGLSTAISSRPTTTEMNTAINTAIGLGVDLIMEGVNNE